MAAFLSHFNGWAVQLGHAEMKSAVSNGTEKCIFRLARANDKHRVIAKLALYAVLWRQLVSTSVLSQMT